MININKDEQQFLLTDLQEETVYKLQLSAKTLYGTVDTEVLTRKTPGRTNAIFIL